MSQARKLTHRAYGDVWGRLTLIVTIVAFFLPWFNLHIVLPGVQVSSTSISLFDLVRHSYSWMNWISGVMIAIGIISQLPGSFLSNARWAVAALNNKVLGTMLFGEGVVITALIIG